MARIASIVSLVVVGIIVADILTHPAGVSAASAGATSISKPALNGLLGQTS